MMSKSKVSSTWPLNRHNPNWLKNRQFTMSKIVRHKLVNNFFDDDEDDETIRNASCDISKHLPLVASDGDEKSSLSDHGFNFGEAKLRRCTSSGPDNAIGQLSFTNSVNNGKSKIQDSDCSLDSLIRTCNRDDVAKQLKIPSSTPTISPVFMNNSDLAKENLLLQSVSKSTDACSYESEAVSETSPTAQPPELSTYKNSSIDSKCIGPDINQTLDEKCEANIISYRKDQHKSNNLHVRSQPWDETPYKISPVFISSLQCEQALQNLIQLKERREKEVKQLQFEACCNSKEYSKNQQKLSAMRHRLTSLKKVAEQEEILLNIFNGDKFKAATFSQEASLLALTSIIHQFETEHVNVKDEVTRLLGRHGIIPENTATEIESIPASTADVSLLLTTSKEPANDNTCVVNQIDLYSSNFSTGYSTNNDAVNLCPTYETSSGICEPNHQMMNIDEIDAFLETLLPSSM